MSNLGYAHGQAFGDPSGFTRSTGEDELDRFNQWMRSQPWWQSLSGGGGFHSDQRKAQLLAAIQKQGVRMPDSFHIDDAGNFNQKGRGKKIAIIAGIAGATLATMGAAGVFSAAAAPAAGGAAGGAAASTVPTIAGSNLAAGLITGPGLSGLTSAVAPVVGGGVTAAHSLIPGVTNTALMQTGASLFGNLYGAWMQGKAADRAAAAEADAARYAADLQSDASKRAETFSREQAENAFLNNEAARHGNYDIYASRERRLGFIGDEVGLGPREIPSYVPGVDPRFTASGTVGDAAGAPTGDPSGFSQEAFLKQIEGKPFNQQTLEALEPWLASVGSKLTGPNSVGERTKIYDPHTGQWVRVGFGEGKPVWIPQGGGSSAPASSGARPLYQSPTVPFLGSVATAPAVGMFDGYA